MKILKITILILIFLTTTVSVNSRSWARTKTKASLAEPSPTATPVPTPEMPTPSPSPSPTPGPLKKISVSLEYGIFLDDPFTISNLTGLTVNYVFSEKSGIQLDLWSVSARDSDTVQYFDHVNFQEPDHNLAAGYYGGHYTWTPFTSTIAARLGFLGKRDIPFDLTFSPGLGVTMLKSAEITAPPTYVPPAGTSQAAPTVALDLTQRFQIFDHWALRFDFINHLYNETIYSSQTGAQGVSHMTYDNGFTVGFGYSCNLPPPKPEKKTDQPDGVAKASEETAVVIPNACFW
jgi:outer membrane beta-barrel protein